MATNTTAAALLAEAVGSIDPWPGTKWRACPCTRRDELAVTILSAEQRQDRAVVQDPQGGVHPGQDAVVPGRCAADRRGFRGALRRGPLAQRHRLRRAG